MSLPAPIKAGDPLSAAWHNQLRDELARLMHGQVSGATQAALIAAVLEALPSETLIRVRITQVHVPVNGGPVGGDGQPTDAPPYWPSQVSYSYEGIGYPGVTGEQKKPDYGRPAREDDARIWPAALGSVHYVLRVPAADGEGGLESKFVMLSGGTDGEIVARRRCDQPAPLAGAGAVSVEFEEERQRQRLGIVRVRPTVLVRPAIPTSATPTAAGDSVTDGSLS
jgi:hypothetical protein